ncbi:MAG: hypothetical protein IPJ86_16570 [Bacteroidetes bacterium]|jgi:hypothetical protein|nr:hypothetical protein [Bacteroidota bacterium]
MNNHPLNIQPRVRSSTFLLTTVLVLFGLNNLNAQSVPVLINANLTSPDSAVMYTAITNTLVLKGISESDNIRLERTGGPIEMRAGTAIRARLVYREKGSDTIRVYNDQKMILEKIYDVRPLGKPVAALKNFRDSMASVAVILAANELEVYFTGSMYKPIPANRGFTVEIYNKDRKKIKSLRMEKNTFSEELKEQLKKAESGYTVVFRNINGLFPKEEQIVVEPLTIYVK